MFLFSSDSFNYTQARSFCQKWNASLAHVVSEERTEGLAKFLLQNVSSFVGLSSSGKERIWKNEYGTYKIFFTDLISKIIIFIYMIRAKIFKVCYNVL